MAKIRKGDRVVVLSGKDRGKEGTVSAVFPQAGTALVDGVNVVRKHQKPNQQGVMQGGIIDKDMPLPLSRLALVSPQDGKATPRRLPIYSGRRKNSHLQTHRSRPAMNAEAVKEEAVAEEAVDRRSLA